MEQYLLRMVKNCGVLNADLVVGRAATPILGREAPLPFNWGHLSRCSPFSLSHSYMCCHVKKRNCRLLENFEKLMYRIVGTWSHEKSGRESRNLKAGDTVDAIIK